MGVVFEISRPIQLTVQVSLVEKHGVLILFSVYAADIAYSRWDVGSAEEAKQIQIEYAVFNPDFHVIVISYPFCFCVCPQI
jgi:hypothetical protein